jgi:NAD(P)-dependent dehydrogenase (short-subunit alcohol dehydrogenase family)
MQSTGKSREQARAAWAEASALKTLIDPRDVAAVVAFLCSQEAAMITGQDVNVCGGTIMY